MAACSACPASRLLLLLLLFILCRGSKAFKEYSSFDWCALFLPCLRWLRTYKLKEWLLVRPAAAAGG
jgi:hypothetical protein